MLAHGRIASQAVRRTRKAGVAKGLLVARWAIGGDDATARMLWDTQSPRSPSRTHKMAKLALAEVADDNQPHHYLMIDV